MSYFEDKKKTKDKDSSRNSSDSRDIYSSSSYEKLPGLLGSRLRHFKDAMTVDFDKPLTLSDQLIIMVVVLSVSLVLFGSLFLLSRCANPAKISTAAPAGTESVSASEKARSEAGTPQSEAEVQKQSSTEGEDTSEVLSSAASEEPSQSNGLFETEKKQISDEDMHKGTLILVNKECPCHLEGENVAPLVGSGDVYYDVTNYDVSFDKEHIRDFNDMLSDFHSIYGDTDIMVACGYRSYDTQARLYNEEKDNRGEEGAEKWVAPPGFSEHQTGYAVDLNLNINGGSGGIQYSGEDIYSWINSNCYKYGFIVRYLLGKEEITGYEYEPWHFRYVGLPSATYINNNGLTLEEYLDIVHTHPVDDPLIVDGDNGRIWYVYYNRASGDGTSEITVPAGLAYTVSGDNYSGYIVTVDPQAFLSEQSSSESE